MSPSLRPEAAPTLVALDQLIDGVLLRTLEPAMAGLDRLLAAARPTAWPTGEPNGFDGLDRRGTPDRLLPSEWLLATEAPDEFLRRFEHHELGYLRLAQSEERAPATSLVLFDAGPWQLGRPRVAQLACLVVLARRAAAAGVDLRWGILQHPDRSPAAGANALDAFVSARSLDPAAELPLDAFVDDALVVSPWAGPPFPARQLRLHDHGDAVRAELVDHRRGTVRQAVLPMPAPDDGVRLLRNPRATTGSAARARSERLPRVTAPTSNLVFDEQGNKVIARAEPYGLIVYPVPNSPRDATSKVRRARVPSGLGVVAAAGRVKRSLLTVNVVNEGTRINVGRFGGNVTGPVGVHEVKGGPLPVPTEASELGALRWVNGALHVHLGEHLVIVTRTSCVVQARDRSVQFGPFGNTSATLGPFGWAVRHGSNEWFFRGELAGVIPGAGRPFARAVAVGPDGRSVAAWGPEGVERELYRAGERIQSLAVHHNEPVYALATESGRVVIRSWRDDDTLFEVLPE